ncbi:MAG: RNA-binding protein [Candidatus Firestonebacteria bacterium]|nr:RNA-binding protein [Candidatus Firestonebacteria bacterium]
MAKKIFVGNLSYSTSEETLRDAFSQAGTVESVKIIVDKMSGRSKGFGFVEMSSDEEADKAIEILAGKEFDGRTITVNEARPMQPRNSRNGFQRGGGRGPNSGGGQRRNNW